MARNKCQRICRCISPIICLFGSIFVIAFFILRAYFLYPFPYFSITSASITFSLNDSLPATCNLVILVSNTNFMSDKIIYDQFNASLLFNSEIVAQTELESGVQAKHERTLLHPQLIIFSGNSVFSKVLEEDRKHGLVFLEVKLSFLVRFTRHVKEYVPMKLTTDDQLKMGFESDGTIGLGVAYDLPIPCAYQGLG